RSAASHGMNPPGTPAKVTGVAAFRIFWRSSLIFSPSPRWGGPGWGGLGERAGRIRERHPHPTLPHQGGGLWKRDATSFGMPDVVEGLEAGHHLSLPAFGHPCGSHRPGEDVHVLLLEKGLEPVHVRVRP